VWLIPSQLRVSVPASECSTKACDSAAPTSESEPALRVTVSGKVTLRAFSWRGWKTRAWSQLLFGAATLPTSTVKSSLAKWISSLRGSPASPGAALDNSAEPVTSGGYGMTLGDSFARHDQSSCSWKTCPDLFQGADSTPYSRTLPMQGSMRNGVLYRRPTVELRTDASGCSSWPTIRPCSGERSSGANRTEFYRAWATPAASDDVRGTTPYSQAEIDRPQGKPMTLAKDVAEWQTPSSQMHNSRRQVGATEREPLLPAQANQWATPKADDPRAGVCDSELNRKQPRLIAQVTKWSTPRASERMQENSADANTSLSRQVQVISTDGIELSPTAPSTSERRRLNPAFVCWLMGWPWWWTRAEPTSFGAQETESWRCALLRRLSSLCGALE